MQAVGYQARKRSVSRFLSLQIGTEANIFFFSMGSADKSAGGGGGETVYNEHQVEGSAGCNSCYCTYCCCIEETECCGKQLIGGYKTEQRTKLGAICVSRLTFK